MDLPEPRRFLDQKHCRYEPHVLLVPENSSLQMKSSDPVLHTVHMDGAATYNLPFRLPTRLFPAPCRLPASSISDVMAVTHG